MTISKWWNKERKIWRNSFLLNRSKSLNYEESKNSKILTKMQHPIFLKINLSLIRVRILIPFSMKEINKLKISFARSLIQWLSLKSMVNIFHFQDHYLGLFIFCNLPIKMNHRSFLRARVLLFVQILLLNQMKIYLF